MLANLPSHIKTIYAYSAPGFVNSEGNWGKMLKDATTPIWQRAIPGIIPDYISRGFSLACSNITQLHWDNGRISPELFSGLTQKEENTFPNLKKLNVTFNDTLDAYGQKLSVIIKKPKRHEQVTEAVEPIFYEAVNLVKMCPNLEYWRVCHGRSPFENVFRT